MLVPRCCGVCVPGRRTPSCACRPGAACGVVWGRWGHMQGGGGGGWAGSSRRCICKCMRARAGLLGHGWAFVHVGLGVWMFKSIPPNTMRSPFVVCRLFGLTGVSPRPCARSPLLVCRHCGLTGVSPRPCARVLATCMTPVFRGHCQFGGGRFLRKLSSGTSTPWVCRRPRIPTIWRVISMTASSSSVLCLFQRNDPNRRTSWLELTSSETRACGWFSRRRRRGGERLSLLWRRRLVVWW